MKKLVVIAALALALSFTAAVVTADEEAAEGPLVPSTFTGLAWRALGPAINSGRIADLAVDPDDHATWYVAVASGGVWKTTNAGVTFTPLFDDEGSYSIGCVTIDPNDSNTIWVGSGENNSQRSVSYGDGVYRSRDAGASWTNVGLAESEHIGRILVDPRDSDVVYVAAQGPLWRDGGDRGLYKTTDGGESWTRVLAISDRTGVTDVVFAPDDPDTLYAAAYQRRRRVWTLIDGGPEGGIHKSTDGGSTWRELTTGLPSGDIGRIGLAVAASHPDLVYAIVEASGDEGGFFRSADRGESWEKRSSYVSGSPQYYQELVVDPHDADRVYSMDTWMQVSYDGGASFANVGEDFRHIDNHALWIDPDDTDHLVNGNDGGLAETWDRGATWDFKANLPVTQFYRVALDDASPFYTVYGGTQDNFTLGGPSRTATAHGINNRDWFVTVGGDGFETQVEPGNPNIVYSQYQYGGLVRYDRASGEILDIQPQPEPGEALKFNWDAPLLISPHEPQRLYFGANRLFRSDDRGGSWRPVSGDLTRGIDRNTLPVMGEVWSVDAVAKNRSTSQYGNLVALSESPLVEGLLYVGTDDGLVQVSEDGGGTWRAIDSIRGVPEGTYVADLEASRSDPDTVYATFDAHKDGDFHPYVFASEDRGRSWRSITGDLPERGTVYTIVQDEEDPALLFVGTEFSVFFTRDGERWIELGSGLPTIAVRDLEIQRREDDLVAGTFGRGFFVLDDYSALRGTTAERLGENRLFGVRRAWSFIPAVPLGLPSKSFQGDNFYIADNPPFGAVFTYYLAEDAPTLEEMRQDAETAKRESGEAIAYPSWDELRTEEREREPTAVLTVRNAAGEVVRRIEGPVGAGFHRVAWDLRYPPTEPVDLSTASFYNPFSSPPRGPLAAPGEYSVSLATVVRDEVEPIGEAQRFTVEPLGRATLPAADRPARLAFQREVAELQRVVLAATERLDEADERITHLRRAVLDTPAATDDHAARLRTIELSLADHRIALEGDRTVARRSEPTTPGIVSRVRQIVGGAWDSTAEPTGTHRRNLEIARHGWSELEPSLDATLGALSALEDELDRLGAPWTPGRGLEAAAAPARGGPP